jgi:hypothetical protein
MDGNIQDFIDSARRARDQLVGQVFNLSRGIGFQPVKKIPLATPDRLEAYPTDDE